ncbi:FAD-dependent oxidoreductase [Klebsiella variicola subsp. variicola]|nr:FAD-dependent oxidoreductase [Klebsiella variicola subsp. variicola]
MPVLPANAPKRLAVVGAGPAGLAFAVNAAALAVITSRCSMRSRRSAASLISPNRSPGKEEFHETLRYYRTMLDLHGVDLRLNTRVTADDLLTFDETILATGIAPRLPAIDGIDHPKVLSYLDVLRDKTPVGEKVAIIGCGGIGFDTAMYLSQSGAATSQDIGEVLPRMGYRYQPANGGRAAS